MKTKVGNLINKLRAQNKEAGSIPKSPSNKFLPPQPTPVLTKANAPKAPSAPKMPSMPKPASPSAAKVGAGSVGGQNMPKVNNEPSKEQIYQMKQQYSKVSGGKPSLKLSEFLKRKLKKNDNLSDGEKEQGGTMKKLTKNEYEQHEAIAILLERLQELQKGEKKLEKGCHKLEKFMKKCRERK